MNAIQAYVKEVSDLALGSIADKKELGWNDQRKVRNVAKVLIEKKINVNSLNYSEKNELRSYFKSFSGKLKDTDVKTKSACSEVLKRLGGAESAKSGEDARVREKAKHVLENKVADVFKHRRGL